MPLIAVCLAVLLLWFFVNFNISAEIASGFIGVLLGGIITAGVQFYSEKRSQYHQLRMAALEKRLEAHQKAYTYWIELMFANKETGELNQIVMESQDWWDKNCLYLTEEARKAFQKAYMAAPLHAQLLKIHADADEVIAAANDIKRAGPIIVKGVNLPPIGDETTRVK